ncbi:Twinfilin-1 [Coemansia sp. RSA 2618]|nr:Twinfilin-1 [Coemansia sp. RSA 2618]
MAQSGIRVSEALALAFRDALTSPVRILQAHIVGETVEVGAQQPIQGTLLDDFASVPSLLSDTEACYLLVRQDTDKWVFAAYVPDAASVRSKMLYAATKASVMRSLGESYFADTMFGITRDEFSASGYTQHCEHAEASAPLTERELELERIRDMEQRDGAVTMDERRNHMTGVAYPLDAGAEKAVREFARGVVNFVVLEIDMGAECVICPFVGTLQTHDDLARNVPEATPCFVLYWFDSATPVFIYWCPAQSSVRKRMVYSTFRHGFIVTARGLGVELAVRLEVDDLQELAADKLKAEIASRTAAPAAVSQPKFKRPVPPNRRPRTTPTADSA